MKINQTHVEVCTNFFVQTFTAYKVSVNVRSSKFHFIKAFGCRYYEIPEQTILYSNINTSVTDRVLLAP